MLKSEKAAADVGAREVDAALDHLDELLGDLNRSGDRGKGGQAEGNENRPDLAAAMISNAQAGQLLSGVRVPFAATQRIAPLRGDRMPDESEFFPVQCCDLATGGISFLMETRPEFTELVIAFGTPPDVTYLAAEVVHSADVVTRPSGQWERVDSRLAGEDNASDYASDGTQTGRIMVQVGCRFTRRTSLEADGRQQPSE